MQTPKNIQIPYQTFQQLTKLCQEIKELIIINSLSFDYYSDLEDVISTLKAKQNSLDNRQTYGRLVAANKTDDEDKKTEARIEYLKNRQK